MVIYAEGVSADVLLLSLSVMRQGDESHNRHSNITLADDV